MSVRPAVAPAPLTSPPPRWLWVVLALMHVAALAYQLTAGHWFFPDSDRYWEAARNLWHHGTLYARPWPPGSPQEYSIRPPGYPLWLLLGGLRVPTVLALQNLLSLFSLWLVARWLSRHLAMSAGRWRLFAALALTAPAQFIYANALMSEVVLQALVVGLWLMLTRFLTHWRLRDLGWAALLAAAALLVKPVFYPFAGVLALLGAWAAWRRRQLALLLIALLPAAVAGAWQWRNYRLMGDAQFSAIADINLLQYNTRALLRATEGPAAAEQFVDSTVAAALRQPDYAAEQRLIRARCGAKLRQYPWAYASLHARGMVNCFVDPGRFDLIEFAGLPNSEATGLLHQFDAGGYRGLLRGLTTQPWALLLTLGGVLLANVARALAFSLFLANRRAPLAARVVAAGLVLYVVALTGPLGASRFLVPVLPLLLLGAGGRPIRNSRATGLETAAGVGA